jgi:hypothetical protein
MIDDACRHDLQFFVGPTTERASNTNFSIEPVG